LADTDDVSCTERLAFERLLGDLSAQFADLPADRVVDEIAGALRRLIDFLGFDRSGFGELADPDGPFEVLCFAVRDGIEPCPLGDPVSLRSGHRAQVHRGCSSTAVPLSGPCDHSTLTTTYWLPEGW
jgi:hypothetical protein